MSTHNICFHAEIRRIFHGCPVISGAIASYFELCNYDFYSVSDSKVQRTNALNIV